MESLAPLRPWGCPLLYVYLTLYSFKNRKRRYRNHSILESQSFPLWFPPSVYCPHLWANSECSGVCYQLSKISWNAGAFAFLFHCLCPWSSWVSKFNYAFASYLGKGKASGHSVIIQYITFSGVVTGQWRSQRLYSGVTLVIVFIAHPTITCTMEKNEDLELKRSENSLWNQSWCSETQKQKWWVQLSSILKNHFTSLRKVTSIVHRTRLK